MAFSRRKLFHKSRRRTRGWNMGGTAKELYETGIRTSFQQAGASGTDNYLNDNTSTAAAYRDPASPSNNVTAGSPLLSTITIKWNEPIVLKRSWNALLHKMDCCIP